MIYKKAIITTIIALSIAMMVSCNDVKNGENNPNRGSANPETVVNEESSQHNDEKTIMDDFETLLNNNDDLIRVIKYVDNNISLVSHENASTMVNKLEELQKDYFSKIEEKFYSSDIQQKLMDGNISVNDLNSINNINDTELKQLLTEIRENGFKIDTGEGMYFPVVNYEFFKKYSDYVTEDIKEYIEIMAKESFQAPSKDAGLVITWDEILNRALKQEKFISEYPSSDKVNDIKVLYKRYVWFLLYGTDNTALFSYDKKILVSEVKEAYTDGISSNEQSELQKSLSELLEALNNNNYKLTKTFEAKRDSLFKKLTK